MCVLVSAELLQVQFLLLYHSSITRVMVAAKRCEPTVVLQLAYSWLVQDFQPKTLYVMVFPVLCLLYLFDKRERGFLDSNRFYWLVCWNYLLCIRDALKSGTFGAPDIACSSSFTSGSIGLEYAVYAVTTKHRSVLCRHNLFVVCYKKQWHFKERQRQLWYWY